MASKMVAVRPTNSSVDNTRRMAANAVAGDAARDGGGAATAAGKTDAAAGGAITAAGKDSAVGGAVIAAGKAAAVTAGNVKSNAGGGDNRAQEDSSAASEEDEEEEEEEEEDEEVEEKEDDKVGKMSDEKIFKWVLGCNTQDGRTEEKKLERLKSLVREILIQKKQARAQNDGSSHKVPNSTCANKGVVPLPKPLYEDGTLPTDILAKASQVHANSLIGYIMGGKMTFAETVQKLRRMFENQGLLEVLPLNHNLVLLKFQTSEHFQAILENNPRDLARFPLYLSRYVENVTYENFSPKTLDVWVDIFKMPLAYYSTDEGISYVAKKFGEPIGMDEITAQKKRPARARVLVRVSAEHELKKEVMVPLSDGTSQAIYARYDIFPPRCESCKVFGHYSNLCTKHPIVQSEQIPQPVGGNMHQKRGQSNRQGNATQWQHKKGHKEYRRVYRNEVTPNSNEPSGMRKDVNPLAVLGNEGTSEEGTNQVQNNGEDTREEIRRGKQKVGVCMEAREDSLSLDADDGITMETPENGAASPDNPMETTPGNITLASMKKTVQELEGKNPAKATKNGNSRNHRKHY